MGSFKNTFLIMAIFLALAPKARASWATSDDADYSVESENIIMKVNADGTSETRVDRTVQVLKESARMSLGVSHFIYDPDAETFTLVKAETINGNKVLPVSRQFIEDKAIASDTEGFDNRNQVSVVYPDVKVGSKIHEVYVEKVKKLGIKGFFSKRIYYGYMEYLKARHLEIHAATPLHFQVNDPLGRLKIVSDKTNENVTIDLKSPLFAKVIHENNALLNEDKKTWVVVANSDDFNHVFKPLAEKFEAVISQPIPAAFQEIADDASQEKTTVAKINAVTSKLAELLRYVGDWREVKGAYEPHPLETIATTRFGDCKDFSVSTAAILRKLGMKATALALERGRLPTPWPQLPLLTAANHAMVKVEADGKTFFIDPTNFQSYAQGTFDDVANRTAILLDPSHIRLEHIPMAKPGDSNVITDVAMNFFKNGDVNLKGFMALKGRAAVPVTGASLFAPQEELSYQLATSFFPDHNLKDYKVDGLDLTSRIVQDARFNVQLTAQNTSLKTTAGYALKMPDAGIVNTISDVDLRTRVADLILQNPMTMKYVYRLKNVKVVGDKLAGCELTSPWLNASFKFVRQGHAASIMNVFSTKTPTITIEDLKSSAFQSFQKQFRDCFENIAVVYLPLGKQVKMRTLSSTN